MCAFTFPNQPFYSTEPAANQIQVFQKRLENTSPIAETLRKTKPKILKPVFFKSGGQNRPPLFRGHPNRGSDPVVRAYAARRNAGAGIRTCDRGDRSSAAYPVGLPPLCGTHVFEPATEEDEEPCVAQSGEPFGGNPSKAPLAVGEVRPSLQCLCGMTVEHPQQRLVICKAHGWCPPESNLD